VNVLERHTLSEALKMETVCFSEMFASTYKSAQCQNPEEEHHHHPHCHENLKSETKNLTICKGHRTVEAEDDLSSGL
jgi:hypothetical protein